MQRIANPSTPVRFRPQPQPKNLRKFDKIFSSKGSEPHVFLAKNISNLREGVNLQKLSGYIEQKL